MLYKMAPCLLGGPICKIVCISLGKATISKMEPYLFGCPFYENVCISGGKAPHPLEGPIC